VEGRGEGCSWWSEGRRTCWLVVFSPVHMFHVQPVRASHSLMGLLILEAVCEDVRYLSMYTRPRAHELCG